MPGKYGDWVGVHNGIDMYFLGSSYLVPSLKLFGFSSDNKLMRAIDIEIDKRIKMRDKGKSVFLPEDAIRTYKRRTALGIIRDLVKTANDIKRRS